MNHTVRTTSRLASAVGLTALCLVAMGAGPAPADSGTIAYTCAVGSFHGENDGQSDGFAMTAKFTSAITDGMEVPVGSSVQLSPVSSQFTVSAPLVEKMRDLGVPEGTAKVTMDGSFGPGGRGATVTSTDLEFDFGGGVATVEGSGTTADQNVEVAGPHTLTAGKVHLDLVHAEGFTLGFITCEVAEGGRAAIDTVVGVEPAPADIAPSRPSVVQTDALQDPEGGGVPAALVAGGALVALTGAAGARRLRSRR